MTFRAAFFTSFNRAGLGRKPRPARLREVLKVRTLDAICLAHLDGLFGNAVPAWLRHFKAGAGVNSRKRTITPILTFWAFLAQVLDAGSLTLSSALTQYHANIYQRVGLKGGVAGLVGGSFRGQSLSFADFNKEMTTTDYVDIDHVQIMRQFGGSFIKAILA